MPKSVSDEERKAYMAEFSRRASLAREKGEELQKKIEPKLIAEGYTGCHAYIDVHTGRYVIGKDYEEATKKAKELGDGRLCWGFDIGLPPQTCLSATH